MATSSVRSQAASILAHLQDQCLLVNVSFHRWTGQAVIRDAEVSTGSGVLQPPKIALPHWQLLPPSLKREVDRIESRVRAELSRRTEPFLLKGVRVVPWEMASDLFNELVTLRAELTATVETLITDGYADLLREIESRLGSKAFVEAKPYVPDPETMASRFGIEWSVFSLVAPAPARGKRASVPFLQEAERQFEKGLVDAASELVRRLRGELAEAARNLADTLESGGMLKAGTLGQVRRAYVKQRAFRCLADDRLLGLIDRLDRRIASVDPLELKRLGEPAKRDVVKLLRDLAAAASSEKAIQEVLRHPMPEPATA